MLPWPDRKVAATPGNSIPKRRQQFVASVCRTSLNVDFYSYYWTAKYSEEGP